MLLLWLCFSERMLPWLAKRYEKMLLTSSDYACQGADVDYREHCRYRVPLLNLAESWTDTSHHLPLSPALFDTFYKSWVGIAAVTALFLIVFYRFLKLLWGFLFTGCLLGQRSSSLSHCSNRMQRKRPWRIMTRTALMHSQLTCLHNWTIECCLELSIRLEKYGKVFTALTWPEFVLDHATCSSFFQAKQALSTAEETLMQAQEAGPQLINLARIGKSVVDSM